jgi:hypothetical protein
MRLSTICLLLVLATSAQSQTLGSCPIFPSNNPWNTRIDTLPVHWNSAKYIHFIDSSSNRTTVHPDFGSNPSYGIPWVAVNGSQAFVPIDLSNGTPSESDPGPMPIPPNAPVEGGGVGDAHVLVVDTSNHHLYELYQGVKTSNGWSATSSAIFALDSNNYRPDGWTSCDAAGLPIWPGLVRMYECQAGEIKHALRFTVKRTQAAWIFPARHKASSIVDTTAPPMGLRMRLRASFDDSKFTGFAKVISTAMKRYGIILADNGSGWFVSGETNTSWPDGDIQQLTGIHGNDFEAVYTGPIRVRPNQFPDPVFPLPSGGGTSGKISASAIIRDTALTGTSNTFRAWVNNIGTAVLNITTIKVNNDGAAYTITGLPARSIAPDSSTSVTLKFAPKTPGQAVDTLTIKSDDATNPALKIALVGLGTAGVFHVARNPLQAGKVVAGKSDTVLLSMSNTGNGPLDVDIPNQAGSNPNVFSLIRVQPLHLPPFTMNPGDSVVATIVFMPSQAGFDTTRFDLTLTEYQGKQRDTAVYIVGEGLPGASVASSSESAFEFSIFPNPASGIVTLRIQGTESPGMLEVVDVLGRTVLKAKIQSQTESLDLGGLPNGSYFVHLTTPSGRAIRHIDMRR